MTSTEFSSHNLGLYTLDSLIPDQRFSGVSLAFHSIQHGFQKMHGWYRCPFCQCMERMVERCKPRGCSKLVCRFQRNTGENVSTIQPYVDEIRRPLAQPNKPIQGSTADRELDIGFVSDATADKTTQCQWSQILYPGELKSNPTADTASKAWLDFSRYARKVLAAQNTRRFVLGFTLCGSFMRIWAFDRLVDTEELASMKKGEISDEADFVRSANEYFTEYYRPLIPCVTALRKVFPHRRRWTKEDMGLYDQMKNILNNAQVH